MEETQAKKPKRRIGLLIVIVFLLGLGIVAAEFRLETIDVIGSEYYSAAEIRELVFKKPWNQNTLTAWFMHRIAPPDEIPFVENIVVEYSGSRELTVYVEEKLLSGSVKLMGEYVYFDQNGIALESSKDKISEVPEITGLQFDHFVLGERLPISDEQKFAFVLKITQLMQKNQVEADKVRFSLKNELTLYKGDIVVKLGKDINMEEKFADMPSILESAERKKTKGTIRMENYSFETKAITVE